MSDDSFLNLEVLIEEAKKAGLNGICLTEHDRFWDQGVVAKISKTFNFPVFAGCEITTEDGHILIFGLDQYVFGMHKSGFLKGLVEKANGALIAAHPYRRRYREWEVSGNGNLEEMLDKTRREEVFRNVDAIEVLNGRGSEGQNGFSKEVADIFEMNCTGASDSHKIADVGTYATEFEKSINSVHELIAELKEGRFSPVVLKKETTASTNG